MLLEEELLLRRGHLLANALRKLAQYLEGLKPQLNGQPERIQRLWDNTHFLKQGLVDLGFDTGASVSPVIPVVIGDFDRCLQAWRLLQDKGIFVNPVVPPGVPAHRSLIRISVTAGHTRDQLTHALEVFEAVGHQLHILDRHV